MVISKKIYNFSKVSERFHNIPGRGSNFFQGDQNANFYRNGYNL